MQIPWRFAASVRKSTSSSEAIQPYEQPFGTLLLTCGILINSSIAPLAQLDRAFGYEPKGREFESLRARHFPPFFASILPRYHPFE